MAAKGRMQ
jgi:hypothetical protein